MNSSAANQALLSHLADHHQQQLHQIQNQLEQQQQQQHALDPNYALFRDQTRFWIQRVAVPLIMVIGLFGNLVTVIIMTSRRMRSTTNLYLAALAFVDMLYLVLTFLLGLSHYPNMAAKQYALYWHARPFLMMLTDACSNTSVWLTVTFTIERYIAVRWPMKGKLWCTEARAKKLIWAVFVVGLLFASPVPFEWKVIERAAPSRQPATGPPIAPGDTTTAPATTSGAGGRPRPAESAGPPSVVLALDYSDFGRNETYKTIYYWSTAVIFYFIPLLSLTLFNSFLIKSVHQSQRERNKMTNRHSLVSHRAEHSPQQLVEELRRAPPRTKSPLGDGGSDELHRQRKARIGFKRVLEIRGPARSDAEAPGGRECRVAANGPGEQSADAATKTTTTTKTTPPTATTATATTTTTTGRQMVLVPISEHAKRARKFRQRRFLSLGEEVDVIAIDGDDKDNDAAIAAADSTDCPEVHRAEQLPAGERNRRDRAPIPKARRRLESSLSVPENCDKSDQVVVTCRILQRTTIDGRPRVGDKSANSINGRVRATLGAPAGPNTGSGRQHLHLPLQRTSTSITQLAQGAAGSRLVSSQSASSLARTSSMAQQTGPGTGQAASSASSQERRITIMLISVVILFLVCQIPSAAMLLYTSVHETAPNTNEHALLLAFGNIFNFLMAINAAGNFILYSFLSRKYRRTFVILFCSCFSAKGAGLARNAAGNLGSGANALADRARRPGAASKTNTAEPDSCEAPAAQLASRAAKLSHPHVSYSSLAFANSATNEPPTTLTSRPAGGGGCNAPPVRLISVRFNARESESCHRLQASERPAAAAATTATTTTTAKSSNGQVSSALAGEPLDCVADQRRTTLV